MVMDLYDVSESWRLSTISYCVNSSVVTWTVVNLETTLSVRQVIIYHIFVWNRVCNNIPPELSRPLPLILRIFDYCMYFSLLYIVVLHSTLRRRIIFKDCLGVQLFLVFGQSSLSVPLEKSPITGSTPVELFHNDVDLISIYFLFLYPFFK